MQKSALVCWIMLSCSLAFGQLDSNSITVNVSRSSNVQPDQVVFGNNVPSGVNTSLDGCDRSRAGFHCRELHRREYELLV
jgi:hypothetical protein